MNQGAVPLYQTSAANQRIPGYKKGRSIPLTQGYLGISSVRAMCTKAINTRGIGQNKTFASSNGIKKKNNQRKDILSANNSPAIIRSPPDPAMIRRRIQDNTIYTM